MENLAGVVAAICSLVAVFYLVCRGSYCLWLWPKMIERKLKGQGIRGSPYKFFFGDVEEMGKSMATARSRPMDVGGLNPHRYVSKVIPFLVQQVQHYGDISLFWMFTTPWIIIQDPELIKEVLTNRCGQFQTFSSVYASQRLARGLNGLEGDAWSQHRTILNPAFQITKLKGLVPSFCITCGEMIERWKKLTGSEGFCELDVQLDLNTMTGDAISRTAFGSSYKEVKRIFELQKKQIDLILKDSKLAFIPGFRFLPTKNKWRRYNLGKEVDRMLRVLIQKKEMALKSDESGHEDLLGLMLRSNEYVQKNAYDAKLKGLTLQEVIEESKLFYFAGYETTSGLLTWTIIILSMHPSWQERAREEVQAVCRWNLPSYESISQFKILNMVLHEVLRLYPALAAHYRHTCKKAKLGGILIPAGVDLVLPTLAIHHDSKIWGEDAEDFNPERFSEGVLKATNNQFSYVPFGWGPRTCIGQNFALIQTKIALAMMLQHFSFEVSPSYVHSPISIVTIQPQFGAPIILRQL